MAKKLYTTKRQRELLESIKITHEQGRTREEADALIQRCIESGKLPRNCLSPPTEKQLSYLASLGVSLPPDITREEASELLDRTIAERNKARPITAKQFEYIQILGGIPNGRMNMYQAGQFIECLQESRLECGKCGHWYDRRFSRCDECGAFVQKLAPIKPPAHIYQPTQLAPIKPPAHIYQPTLWERILSWFGL